jgi:hypothetical protein
MVYTRYGNLVRNAAEAGRFEAYMNAQGITLADALKEMVHMDEAARRDAFLRPRNSTAPNGQDHGDQQGQHISNGDGLAVHDNGSVVGDAELTDGEDTVIAPPVPVLPPNPITWGVDTRVCVECVSRVLEYVISSVLGVATSLMIKCADLSLIGGGFESGRRVSWIVRKISLCSFSRWPSNACDSLHSWDHQSSQLLVRCLCLL